MGQAFQCCRGRIRYSRLKLKWEVLTRSKEKPFHYEDSQVLEKVGERICAFSILRGFQVQAE